MSEGTRRAGKEVSFLSLLMSDTGQPWGRGEGWERRVKTVFNVYLFA